MLSNLHPAFLDKGTEKSCDTVGLCLPTRPGKACSKSGLDVCTAIGLQVSGSRADSLQETPERNCWDGANLTGKNLHLIDTTIS